MLVEQIGHFGMNSTSARDTESVDTDGVDP